MRAFAAIILLCIVASVVYGVIHDQFTARICIEYFTVTHPPLVNSNSPTVIGLAWGIWATWWMGAFLGVFVALCARLGNRLPKLTWKSLVVPLLVVLVLMGIGAAMIGPAIGGYNYTYVRDQMVPPSIAPEKARAWLICLGIHNISYSLGTVGGFALCIYTIIVRVFRARRAKSHPSPPPLGSHP